MNQPLRGPEGVAGSTPLGASGRASRARVEQASSRPAPTPSEGLEAPTTSRLRAAAAAAPPTASSPAALERAKERLATGFYHSPEGLLSTAERLLGAASR